jgi:RNA polymerase sigma factor (TIGR02999 family)
MTTRRGSTKEVRALDSMPLFLQRSGCLVGAARHEKPALVELFSGYYADLLRVARHELQRSGAKHLASMDGRALVHEAYITLCQRHWLVFDGRAGFIHYVTRVMRGILVGEIRKCMAQKRGARLQEPAPADDQVACASCFTAAPDTLAALHQLESDNPNLAAVVHYRIHHGYSVDEIAAATTLSRRTVERRWAQAVQIMRLIVFDD